MNKSQTASILALFVSLAAKSVHHVSRAEHMMLPCHELQVTSSEELGMTKKGEENARLFCQDRKGAEECREAGEDAEASQAARTVQEGSATVSFDQSSISLGSYSRAPCLCADT